MFYQKEIIHETIISSSRQIPERNIERGVFKEARVKQGGIGTYHNDFWVQRIANRGFHVFILSLSGKGRIRLEDESEFILNAGDAFISWSSGQGQYEESASLEPWDRIWITFWDSTSLMVPDSNDFRVVRNVSNIEEIEYSFKKILQESYYNDNRSTEAQELYEKLFLIHLERGLGLGENAQTRTHRREIARLWELVNKSMADDWGVERLCRVSGFSRAHLSRLCNELYGIGPGEKVKDIRMHHAKLLLANSDRTIAEISDATGFSSPSVFSASFKEYFKQSPREFKKNRESRYSQNGKQ
ncbi:MAG: AraC family transcriptional regulator [Sphaerochaetaceae bacterium]|nr:AraC family transcriptional regulator [Sphaerochaetaceae bacterium]